MRKGIALLLVMAVMTTLTPPAVAALPQNPQVQSGAATWVYHDVGDVLEVDQTSNRVIIDWDRFSIGEGHTVIFHQPSADAAALNRVVGDDPSNIFGTLQADGRVFLVNPHGVIFGPDAVVDVGSLVASALWLDVDVGDNKTFWAEDSDIGLWENGGRLVFEQREGDQVADVVNMGSITAHGEDGYVVLLGPALVRNEGSLSVEYIPGGHNSQRVGLAAGGRVQLTDAVVPDTRNSWDEGLWTAQPRRFVVDQPTADALVETAVGSTIDTSGGSDNVVFLAAASAKELHQSVINQQGIVWARRMEVIGGPEGTVKLGGMYGEASNWDFTMYVEGERISIEGEDDGHVLISSSAGGDDGMVLNAKKEIVIASDLAYRNHTRSSPSWNLFAPTVSFQGDVRPFDEQSKPIDQRPFLWIVNKGLGPLTVTSDEDTTLTLGPLQIDVGDGSVVDMAGALDIGNFTYFRGFGSPDALRLTNRHNRLGERIRLGMDGSVIDAGGPSTLTADDIVIWASDDELGIAGDFHGTGDVFIWNDGGNVVLGHLTRLSADGLLTVAATGGGVFINESGADAFGGGGPESGRVRIYSSSPMSGYDAGGLEAWEHDTDVEFLDDPVGVGNVIYFLDASGALIVVVEVTAPNDGSYTYGELASDTAFEIKYYLKADPGVVIGPDEVENLQLRIVDQDGREFIPLEWELLGVGTYEVVGSGARSERYRLEYAPSQIDVLPAPLEVTIGGASRDYGDDNSVLSLVDVHFSGWALPQDDQNWQIGTHFTLTSAGEDAPVGTYDIKLSQFLGSLAERLKNYDITVVDDDAVLVVRPRPITVEVGDLTRWYGDDNDFTGATFRLATDGRGLALDHTLADIGFDGDPNDFLLSNATPRSVPGTYDVGIVGSALGGEASNYDVTVMGHLVVTKRPIKVAAGHKTVTYLDPVSIDVDNPIVTSDLGQGRDLVHLPQRMVVDALPTPTVGDYVVTWDVPAHGWHDDVYDIEFEDGTMTVVPRPIVVDIQDIVRRYGDEIKPIDYKVSITNIPEATPWFAPQVRMELLGVSALSDVGFYEGAIGGVVDDPNFTPTFRLGNLTITQRPIVLHSTGNRIYGDADPSPVQIIVSGLADWHEVEDVVADVVTHTEGTKLQASAGSYSIYIDDYRLINDNYIVENVLDGNYHVHKRDLWVAVGDIEYHADERKPYPKVRFDNLAPWDTSAAMMRQGCLMWLPNAAGTCTIALYGGDVDDPYFLFQRAQQGRYRNHEWGRSDMYTGPWEWAFYNGSEALRNYNIVESVLGHEMILPALSREEIIDIVLNDRPRDRVFDPETSFEPEAPMHIDGEWSGPIVFVREDVDFTTEITHESGYWVDGRLIPESCLIATGVPFEFRVNETCVEANQALDGFTGGLPNESQDILLTALANWLDTTKDGLTATTLAETYRALQAGDNSIVERVFPFLLVEFYDILDKEEEDLTPGERAYVEHISKVIHEEWNKTANRAQDAYNAWVERNDKRYENSPNLLSMFTFGEGMPDYLKNAATAAELGVSVEGDSHSRKTEMMAGLGSLATTLLSGGGTLIGASGVLQPLVSTVFPFAARAGEAAVLLSGVSIGGAVLGSVAFVATIVTTVVMELVERENVRRKIDEALERAAGMPPTFAELKAMKQTEEGELLLMMHAMTAFDQYAPGGTLDHIAKGWPPISGIEFQKSWDDTVAYTNP